MARYEPKTLTVKRGSDGRFWVHDAFGPWDGPYSEADAWFVATSDSDGAREFDWRDQNELTDPR